MANCGKDILLAREGTEQMQRFLDALDPSSVKLNDLGLEEWMQFAYNFAKHVNYFDINNSETPAGDWTDFLKTDNELQSFLSNVEEGYDITPHLALFVSFIKLLEIVQGSFNGLTKKHLDFYYGQILQIEKQKPVVDQVHIIFELAKNIVTEKISINTELDGGKDIIGKKRVYKTTEELIASKVKVAQLKSVYNDIGNSKLKVAEVANSYDGVGGDFPGGEVKWWPFGYYQKVKDETKSGAENNKEYPELPDAKIGFALSSEVLELKEGLRNIRVTIDFLEALKIASVAPFFAEVQVFCSGEKAWLGPFKIQANVKDDAGDKVVYSSTLSANKKKLTLAFQVPKDEAAVVNYDSKIVGEFFSTKLPVCRFLIKTENPEGYALYRTLEENEVSGISVEVDVRDVKSLLLESDIGTLNAEKPFYPFGTQPVRKSNFYIDYPELFKKEWTKLDVVIEWKNTPNNFQDLYYAYREKYRYKVTPANYLSGLGSYDFVYVAGREFAEKVKEFKQTSEPVKGASDVEKSIFTPSEDDLIVENDAYFKVNIEIQNKEDWELVLKNYALFQKEFDIYKTIFSINNATYVVDKNGPLRLSLNQSFLQELFPRIYALALSSEDENALIPNEPYIPFVETVRLNYSAKSSFNPGKTRELYDTNQVLLFHEHPFGQSEEHQYLRSSLNFVDATKNKDFLVPTYCKGGELYLGLENVEKLQQVSLLVQVLEGSENPLAESFTGKQKVEWSVLCSNEWKSLDSNYMISNQTDNFLKSGIVKFAIPGEASTTNALLPGNLIWVKAKIHKSYNAVCKTIAIIAQAVLAEFFDNDNDLSHLENGLEAKTISKLIQRVATVKSVNQPFNSFGGKPEESDEAYYRRISERLRHKNRAVSIWDYEHIILQQFPEIHKVKCLNHSTTSNKGEETITNFLSPGNILVVVIPDIVHKNVFDIYQPRVSKATLNEVQNWINRLNSLHAIVQVINPVYEEVTVQLKVSFYKGFDANYYMKVLNEDITKLLSPWAFEDTENIDFGVALHRSVVINYIEKLEYVDYVEEVKLLKGKERSITNVSPSSPVAILVSAKQHNISLAAIACGKGIIETEETCQI